MVVMDYMVGKVRVKINDEFCRDRHPEEIRLILEQIGVNASRHFYEAEKRKRMEV